MIGFVTSSISTKSCLSATSPLHGGGVLDAAGPGPTHTDPTDMTMVTMGMVTGHPAMVTDTTYPFGSHYGSYYSGTNYENDDELRPWDMRSTVLKIDCANARLISRMQHTWVSPNTSGKESKLVTAANGYHPGETR